MRMEDIRYEFPEMPEEMKQMVAQEVQKQLRLAAGGTGQGKLSGPTESTNHMGVFRRRSWTARRMAVAGLAAAMALGTTVLAGSRLYRMHSDQVGNYGAQTRISEETDAKDSAAVSAAEIPNVKLELAYVPEGMANSEMEPLKYHYDTEKGMQGGISFCAYAMDLGDDAFQMMNSNITSREEIEGAEHDIVYLEHPQGGAENASAILYVFFPEVHHVLEMWTGPDVTKEDAVNVAKGAALLPLAEGETAEIGLNQPWSSYAEPETEISDEFVSMEEALADAGKAHAIGETVPLEQTAYLENGEYLETADIAATVVSVETADGLDLLGDRDHIDVSWLEAVDETGHLLPNELQYIRSGDGIETIDEVVQTEKVPQKLIYVTMEYTNTGEQTLTDVLFYTRLLSLCESEKGYTSYVRKNADSDADWDTIVNTGAGAAQIFNGDMGYFDPVSTGGQNGGNYIDTLAPGETATVHLAWIVNEDELPYLYLNLGSNGTVGDPLVDIRQ